MKNVTYALLVSLALTTTSSQAIGYESAAYVGQRTVAIATQICKAIYQRWFANQIEEATRPETCEQETQTTPADDKASTDDMDDKALKLAILLSLKSEEDALDGQSQKLAAMIAETQSLLLQQTSVDGDAKA
jgi:hypothetical protein